MTRITRDTPAHEIDRVLRTYSATVAVTHKQEYIVHLYPRSGGICVGSGKTLWSALNRALRRGRHEPLL